MIKKLPDVQIIRSLNKTILSLTFILIVAALGYYLGIIQSQKAANDQNTSQSNTDQTQTNNLNPNSENNQPIIPVSPTEEDFLVYFERCGLAVLSKRNATSPESDQVLEVLATDISQVAQELNLNFTGLQPRADQLYKFRNLGSGGALRLFACLPPQETSLFENSGTITEITLEQLNQELKVDILNFSQAVMYQYQPEGVDATYVIFQQPGFSLVMQVVPTEDRVYTVSRVPSPEVEATQVVK